MDIYNSVIKLPEKDGLGPAFATASFCAFAGWSAGRLRGTLANFAPSVKSGGTILLFLLSVAMHWAAGWKMFKKFAPTIRAFANGVAGFVGNDMWFVLRAWVKWGKWKPETAYPAGKIVMHDVNGKLEFFKTDKDIPATPTAEPGKDSRWVRFETAQGITVTEITEFAQALRGNDAMLDGIVKEQLIIFGPELAQAMGRELSQQEADNLYSGMRDSLKSVVIKFSEG